MIALTDLADGPTGGPALLVGPSLGSRVDHLWGPCLPALGRVARVVGWDLPGHGAADPSDAPWTVDDLTAELAATVARLRERHPVVVVTGVSIGGAATLLLGATEGPGRPDGIGAVCTSPWFGGGDAWRERARTVRAEGTASLAEGSRKRWFSAATARDEVIVRQALDDLAAVDDDSYAHACEALAIYDARPVLGRVSVPTLALGGQEDVVCPPEVTRDIATRTGGVAVVLPDVAHLAPLEAPAPTSRELLSLLERASGSPTPTAGGSA